MISFLHWWIVLSSDCVTTRHLRQFSSRSSRLIDTDYPSYALALLVLWYYAASSTVVPLLLTYELALRDPIQTVVACSWRDRSLSRKMRRFKSFSDFGVGLKVCSSLMPWTGRAICQRSKYAYLRSFNKGNLSSSSLMDRMRGDRPEVSTCSSKTKLICRVRRQEAYSWLQTHRLQPSLYVNCFRL